MKDLGERIRRDRLAGKLTLKELAERAGIGVMTLHRIETGKTVPNVHDIINIARELNRSVGELLRTEEGICRLIKSRTRKKIKSGGLKVSILSPRDMDSKGVTASYLIEKAGTILGPLKPEKSWVFVYQINGKVIFEYMGKKYPMKGGDSLYFDGNYEHTVRILEDTESILIFIKK